METDLNFWLQLLTVAFCIGLGGRYGGVGLGAAGGLGVCILVLFFGLKPSSPPVSTILIIVAVIACTSILQGAGGLDWMVKIAERMLRRWPKAITFVAPFVCSFFVIKEVRREALRPPRSGHFPHRHPCFDLRGFHSGSSPGMGSRRQGFTASDPVAHSDGDAGDGFLHHHALPRAA